MREKKKKVEKKEVDIFLHLCSKVLNSNYMIYIHKNKESFFFLNRNKNKDS